MVDHTKEWNYNESFLWGNNYPQCNGLIQSPIDIATEETKECRTLCNIRPRYKPSKCFVNYKNNTISIKYDDGSFDTKNVNTHQAESYKLMLENKVKTLSPGSSQPEVFNAIGQLESLKRVIKEGELLPANERAKLQSGIGRVELPYKDAQVQDPDLGVQGKKGNDEIFVKDF